MTKRDAFDASLRARAVQLAQATAVERRVALQAADADAESHTLLCSYTRRRPSRATDRYLAGSDDEVAIGFNLSRIHHVVLGEVFVRDPCFLLEGGDEGLVGSVESFFWH